MGIKKNLRVLFGHEQENEQRYLATMTGSEKTMAGSSFRCRVEKVFE